MWNWLAKKLHKYLSPLFLLDIKSAIFELEPSKHYLLFLPNSVLDDMSVDIMRKELQPLIGKTNLVVFLTDEFHVVEF